MNELPVMEYFYSIQGEGYHSGKPAFFIRLAGCDIGCHWCDVKESWDAQLHQKLPVGFIAQKVKESNARFIVITGGEPAMYNLEKLTEELKKLNCYIAIETSGAYPVTGYIDWICLSPKKFKPPIESVYKKANELKVIVFNKSDFQWAEQQAEKTTSKAKLYLQVEWDKRNQLLPSVVSYVKENQKWNISTQIHKYINVP